MAKPAHAVTEAARLTDEGTVQMGKRDYASARRSFDAAIRSDPTYWPAFSERARLSLNEDRYEDALRDSNEVLRQKPTFLFAALFRTVANKELGHYKAALNELSHLIDLRPPNILTFEMAYNQRAWILATCPDAALRNGRKAVEDATNACKMTQWKEPFEIDTLAAAFAECGDFQSAVRTSKRAIATANQSKDISSKSRRDLQSHHASFEQHRPWREGTK